MIFLFRKHPQHGAFSFIAMVGFAFLVPTLAVSTIEMSRSDAIVVPVEEHNHIEQTYIFLF